MKIHEQTNLMTYSNQSYLGSEQGGLEIVRVPFGTFAGTHERLFLIQNGSCTDSIPAIRVVVRTDRFGGGRHSRVHLRARVPLGEGGAPSLATEFPANLGDHTLSSEGTRELSPGFQPWVLFQQPPDWHAVR